jgi:hypothetical protein
MSGSPNKVRFGLPYEWDTFRKRHPTFIKKLELLYETLSKVFIRRFTSAEPADRVVFFLGRLCVEDFNEILLLCGNGCGIGGLKILRGLYERTVTLGYIAKHPDEADTFLGYAPVHRGKWLNHLSTAFNIKGLFSEEEIAKVQNEYKNAKSKYQEVLCRNCGTYRTRFSWSSLDMLAMSREAGLHDLYLQCYYEPTLQAHATVPSLTSRMKSVREGHITFDEGPQREKASLALMAAHRLILHTLDIESKYFGLRSKAELQERVADFLEVWGNKHTQAHLIANSEKSGRAC